ncbi:hypothetical protein [Carboxylicivirga sp. N1Y90]|uniref:hypothetical protein n=1 Tax=Carboxylicivirga fragile TaxID=3417571 RepID=UPI003D353C37|nr:hypothetical protein [Marinilabiliaceae bacterium N1Y90]
MKYTFLLTATLFIALQLTAQEKAVTESGKTVILFDNGTWQYEEALKQAVSKLEDTTAPLSAAAVSTLAIDNTVDKKSERSELFYEVSPKMAKYFGDEKGKNRCFVTCFNNKGDVSIKFEINIPVGDGNRYFGLSLKERVITLELTNGNSLPLSITESVEEKFLDKYNQSFFIGAAKLSKEEVAQLLASPIEEVHIDWKKNPETYDTQRTKIIQEAIKEVI